MFLICMIVFIDSHGFNVEQFALIYPIYRVSKLCMAIGEKSKITKLNNVNFITVDYFI